MNSPHKALQHEGTPENWMPMLELACREVFEIMLGCGLELATQPGDPPKEFTAMVGLAGQLCGVITIRCSAASAALIASKMLGVDPAQAGDQMWDALGEVCNMIAGNFKNKVTGMSEGCMLSVPTVITGEDYSFHSLADGGLLELPFNFENAPLVVALEVHS